MTPATGEHCEARFRDAVASLLVMASLAIATVYLVCAILTSAAYGAPAARAHQAGNKAAARGTGHNSLSLSGIVAPLASKAREIAQACNSKVVSAVRIGARVYGGSASNHAGGRAVDLQGNPGCIYAHLRDWPGGVSTDYWTAPGGPHVHVSYNPGGMEWGLRFAHRGRKPAR
jgi:hypothetical protein